jgi:hypothetical protein
MPCPTCSGTLACVLSDTDSDLSAFWCERCGTVSVQSHHGANVYVPKLVERCRQLLDCSVGPVWTDARRLGVTEAIYLPEDRPT